MKNKALMLSTDLRIVLLSTALLIFLVCLLAGCTTGSSGGAGGTSAPPEQFAADANTLALWHFDETSGQVVSDSSGNGYDLYLGSGDKVELADPAFADSGRSGFGNCLLFEGGNEQYASSDDTLSVSTNHDFTIECWVKTSTTGFAVLFASDNVSVSLQKDSDDNLSFAVGDGSNYTNRNTTSPQIANGEWHYLAGTYDYSTTTLTIYIDGTAVLTDDMVDRTVPDAVGLNVGGRPSNTFLTGYIDEMRISDVPRTVTEIQDYYNGIPAE
jgi:hypothetical protein